MIAAYGLLPFVSETSKKPACDRDFAQGCSYATRAKAKLHSPLGQASYVPEQNCFRH